MHLKPGLSSPAWGPARRIGFGFIFCFLALFLFINRPKNIAVLSDTLPLVPGGGLIQKAYEHLWVPVVIQVGHLVFDTSSKLHYEPDGNSDGLFGHLEFFCFAVIAAIAALIWHLASRRAGSHERMRPTLRLWLRYALAFTLLTYGMIKVIKAQFPYPDVLLLRARYGELTPFTLMWSFMGYSTTYTFFAGAAEVLAAALLFFRRTTTLGAVLAGGVLTNVFMMDVSYGVPEKLDVLCLLAMTAVLLAPDVHRLMNIFLLNRPADPAPNSPARSSLAPVWALRTAKAAIVVWMTTYGILVAIEARRDHAELSPLYGAYQVEEFTKNGQVLPPLATDTNRWSEVVFQAPTISAITLMNDSRRFYETETGSDGASVAILSDQGKTTNRFKCARTDAEHLILSGSWSGDEISAKLKRLDESKFPLIAAKHKWMNGFP